MTAKAHVSPRRLELLAHIGDVALWPGGDSKRYVLGRNWKVTADVNWLVGAGLVEVNPDDDDLDLKGYRRTAAGNAALGGGE